MSSLCAVCGKASRTVVGDLGFCPDHSEKDLPKTSEEVPQEVTGDQSAVEDTDYTVPEV